MAEGGVAAALANVDDRDSWKVHFADTMLPGVLHCAGGPGPDQFDRLTALTEWVEKGQAPSQLIATKRGPTPRTRSLCMYPQAAIYKGSGSTDDAANFTCRAR